MNSSMKTRECVKVYGTFNPFAGLDPTLDYLSQEFFKPSTPDRITLE